MVVTIMMHTAVCSVCVELQHWRCSDRVTLYTLGGRGVEWLDDSALNCDWLRNITNNVLQKQ